MASQGIWLRSFLVYGLLLQVSKGQNAKYRIKDWNQNLYKQQTTNEPRLGVFDRVNTTDVPEEFEPVTNASGIIINKPVPGQEMFSDVINAENGNMSRLIKQGVTKVLDAENRAKPQSMIVTRRRALAVKGKGLKGQVQLYSVMRRNKANDLTKARNSRTRGVLTAKKQESGKKMNERGEGKVANEYVVTDGGNVSTKQMPTKDTQNQITTDPQLGILDRVNITDAPKKIEPVTNILSQTRTTTESQLGIFDRINTTDVPEEFEPVTNYKGVIINKPVQGQELYNDILTQEQITINRDKVNEMSLTQTRTTAKPCQEALDKANATDSPKEFEPLTNTTKGITNSPVSGQEMQNYTLTSGNGNTSRLIKQAARKVQEKESFDKPQNMVVKIFKAFNGKDSKDQIQLYSVIGNNLGNYSIQTRKSRKRSEHTSKDKEGGKKVKKNR